MQLIKKLLGPRPLFYASLFYTSVITVLFLLPVRDIPKVAVKFGDKWAHVVVFFMLTLLWLLATMFNKWFVKNNMLWVSFWALIYGIVIEALQERFFETRSADVWDVIADAIGILIACFVFFKLKKRISLKT